MKTTKDHSEFVSQQLGKINEFFSTNEEKLAIISCLLGMSNLMAEFLTNQEFIQPNTSCKYAILQTAWFIALFRKILDGTVQRGNFDIQNMPEGKNAWKTEGDMEKRLIFVVKQYYEQLKKEGKIK